MAISHEQKMGVALRFVTQPRPYINRGNFIDAHLCDFQGGHLGFKFSERGGSKPGLGIYVRGHRQEVENTFAQVAIPLGFELNRQQQHVGMNDNGWIAFCKNDCANQNAVYMDIVEPGAGLDQWRSLFNALRQKITEEFGNVENCGDIQEGNKLPPTMTVPEPASDSADEGFDEGEDDEMTVIYPLNRIFFGAPGTGKSHELDKQVHKTFVDGDGDNRHVRYERVTFYPTYSYAQFVGTYKPVMEPVKDAQGNPTEKEEISYKFEPGPFLRRLVKALNDLEHEHCLVIEEINRANAAAVFGDVFQLLDRGSNGVSEYSIAASEDIKKYLQKELGGSQYAMEFLKVAKKKNTQGMETAEWESCSLRIPSNMYIWATMNSADQGVFPMDTAFKRRWAFEYIGIDDRVTDECRRWMTVVKGYNWNELRRFINGLLSAYDVNEDKLMGPYFVKADNGNSITKNLFDSKVLMYLWEDAARMIRKKLFGEKIKTYSQLVTEWNKDGVKVFDDVVEQKTLPDEVKNLYLKLAKGEDEKK